MTRYGMSEKLGPTAIHYDDNGLSGTTRSLVEQEARPEYWSPDACFCCARGFGRSLMVLDDSMSLHLVVCYLVGLRGMLHTDNKAVV